MMYFLGIGDERKQNVHRREHTSLRLSELGKLHTNMPQKRNLMEMARRYFHSGADSLRKFKYLCFGNAPPAVHTALGKLI